MTQNYLKKITVLLLLFFETGFHISQIRDSAVRKDGLVFLIFLFPPTEYWDYSWVSHHTWLMRCWGSFRLGMQEYSTNWATSSASGRNISNYISLAKLNSIPNYISLFVSVMCMSSVYAQGPEDNLHAAPREPFTFYFEKGSNWPGTYWVGWTPEIRVSASTAMCHWAWLFFEFLLLFCFFMWVLGIKLRPTEGKLAGPSPPQPVPKLYLFYL